MKKYFFLFVFVTNLLFAQTTLTDSIFSGGTYRYFRVYIPEIYDSANAVPLVFNLHGYGSNNLEQEYYGDFRTIADTANFILVHPNGTLNSSNQRFWNTFGNSSVDDLGFISRLIDTLSERYSIDQNRVYSTGMSNGGFMSHDLACFLNHKIAAIASVTGTMIHSRKNNCFPDRPTPVMQIHGTADGTVPYNGSSSFVSVQNLVNHWVGLNNCNTTPVVDSIPNTNTTDGCTAVRYIYTDGDNESTVELYKIVSGGHTWPGSAFNTGITNRDFSASEVIWNFFRKYRLDELSVTSAKNNIFKSEKSLELFPNPFSNRLVLNIPSTDIEIYNMQGIKQDLLWDNNEINTEKWTNGIYLVKNKSNSFKLIKQ
jgi:polyhydroxybutyrate depolymerase